MPYRKSLKQVQHDWDIVITGILDYFANARNDLSYSYSLNNLFTYSLLERDISPTAMNDAFVLDFIYGKF